MQWGKRRNMSAQAKIHLLPVCPKLQVTASIWKSCNCEREEELRYWTCHLTTWLQRIVFPVQAPLLKHLVHHSEIWVSHQTGTQLSRPGHPHTSFLGHSCWVTLLLHKTLNYSFSQMAKEWKKSQYARGYGRERWDTWTPDPALLSKLPGGKQHYKLGHSWPRCPMYPCV